jgi:hypothetical protein
MTPSMDLGFISGRMEEDMRDTERKESRMEKEFFTLKDKLKEVYGKMVN